MRFNDLLHLIATLALRLDRGDPLGRRMGDLRRPVSTQPRCRIPVRFPIPQTNFSPYIPLSAFAAGSFPRPRTNILRESCSLREQPQGGQSPSQEQRTTPETAARTTRIAGHQQSGSISPVAHWRYVSQAAPGVAARAVVPSSPVCAASHSRLFHGGGGRDFLTPASAPLQPSFRGHGNERLRQQRLRAERQARPGD